MVVGPLELLPLEEHAASIPPTRARLPSATATRAAVRPENMKYLLVATYRSLAIHPAVKRFN
jgi:hypothetical protein